MTDRTPATLKRNTRIEYTFALGKVVPGKIIKPAYAMAGWYLVELCDTAGIYRACCHHGQIRVIDNAAAA